jgi:hypothetical protein
MLTGENPVTININVIISFFCNKVKHIPCFQKKNLTFCNICTKTTVLKSSISPDLLTKLHNYIDQNLYYYQINSGRYLNHHCLQRYLFYLLASKRKGFSTGKGSPVPDQGTKRKPVFIVAEV